MESDSLTRAWAAALDAVPTDELGPVATSMLRSARPLGDIEGTIPVSYTHLTLPTTF